MLRDYGEKYLVIVPTYNEAENITSLIPAILRQSEDIHVLVVDDASPDGTADLARQAGRDHPGRLHVLERAGKLGLGSAYIAGFRQGLDQGYRAMIEMDADFSHDPAILPAMLRGLESADVVIGSRYIAGGGTRNWSLLRKFISRGGSLYARSILGLRLRDLTGGFNAWNREVLERIGPDSITSEGYSFQIELKYRAACLGFRLEEIPIIFADRRAGESKMSARIVAEAMLRVWAFRFASRRLFQSAATQRNP